MEKLTLNPEYHEIVVNNGSFDGAVDLFSYGPEMEQSLRPLGSLYIVGHRATDSNNMGYIVSLIAALARREYYGQPDLAPREAFARMLKKTNEIVDEFFKSADVALSVGIVAIAGSSIMVSKLDKFKILLARDGQTIDILNNVALFTKEHTEQKRFSSIISGSVQPGDRILAYYPSKPVVSRERNLKVYLTKLPYAEFASKLTEIGRQNTTFAAALVCIDMVQSSAPIASHTHTPTPTEPTEPKPVPPQSSAALAWAPRQAALPTATTSSSASPAAPMRQSIVDDIEPEQEIPHIIATEFSLGIRQSSFSKWFGRLHLVRLDTRGKAIFMACAALVVIGGVLVAKSILFVDPQQSKDRQTVQAAKDDLDTAKGQTTSEPAEARQLLMRALATLANDGLRDNKDAQGLISSLVQTMDTLDNAQAGSLSLTAQLDPKTDTLVMATWSSASQTLWSVVRGDDDALAVARITDGTVGDRIPVESMSVSSMLAFRSGALLVDGTAKKVVRIMDDKAKAFSIATPDTILSAFVYDTGLYLLTDHGILKVSDLDTDKPVTKQWLGSVDDLVAGAAELVVDGSIRTLGHDGMLTEYYKGKKAGSVQTSLEPSGSWHLLVGPQEGQLSIANADTRRIYIIDTKDGSLVRTLKIDTQQPILSMLPGPDGSVLFLTKDNKIWKVQ